MRGGEDTQIIIDGPPKELAEFSFEFQDRPIFQSKEETHNSGFSVISQWIRRGKRFEIPADGISKIVVFQREQDLKEFVSANPRAVDITGIDVYAKEYFPGVYIAVVNRGGDKLGP